MKYQLVLPAAAAAVLSLTVLGASPASADEDGAKVFKKCQACHTLETGKHRVGPSLAGVVGRKAGTAEGYNRYKGLKDADWVWTEDELAKYLHDPTSYTKERTGQRSAMGFKLTKEDEIKAVIGYLKEH